MRHEKSSVDSLGKPSKVGGRVFYDVERGELRSFLVEAGNPVPYVVLIPSDYDPTRAEPYPLLLHLHGGGGMAEELLMHKPVFEAEPGAWDSLAQFIAVCFSCPGKNPENSAGGQFVDYVDGSQNWDRFVIEEFLPHIRRQYNVGNNETGKLVVMGISMGGAGALRISFRHPELFTAAAALEPHIHGGLSFYRLNAHQRAIETPHDAPPLDDRYLGGKLCGLIRQEAYGNPVNDDHWRSWQPANMAVEHPDRLKKSKLQIYLECGDRDEYEFNFAAEYLHRVLLDLGIEHEYRLLRGLGHYGYGSDIEKRLYNALEFLSRQVSLTKEEPQELNPYHELMVYEVESRKRAAGYQEQTISEKYRGICGNFIGLSSAYSDNDNPLI